MSEQAETITATYIGGTRDGRTVVVLIDKHEIRNLPTGEVWRRFGDGTSGDVRYFFKLVEPIKAL